MNQFSDKKKKYDLEERTAKFAEEIIDLVKSIGENAVNKRIIIQLVGAAGSIGANYCEATEAESKKDFIHKIGICKKEIKETGHWLRLLDRSNIEYKEKIRKFWQEPHELLLIFSKINQSAKNKIEN